MLKCCHLLSNILLLASIWMTKHSHLHVQEEVKFVQMMDDDTEVNVMEPKLWSMEITCKYDAHVTA